MFAMTVLNELCDSYDIGRPMLTSSFLQSEASQSYSLITTEGHYTVVAIDQGRSLRAVGCEHQLIRYLRQQGFPTPSLVSTRYGTTVALVRGQLYVLFVAPEGALYDPQQWQHLHAAATALSRLHTLGAGFAELAPSECDTSLDQLFDEGRALFATLEHSIASSHTLKRHKGIHHASAVVSRTLDLLHEHMRLVDTTCLPHTMIHGRYAPDMLVFRDTMLITIYGYEYARYAPRLLDLAPALAAFGCNDESMLGIPSLNLAALRLFLATYNELCDLCAGEVAALPLALRCAWLNAGLRRCIAACHVVGSDEIASMLKGLSYQLDWMEEYAPTIFENTDSLILKERTIVA